MKKCVEGVLVRRCTPQILSTFEKFLEESAYSGEDYTISICLIHFLFNFDKYFFFIKSEVLVNNSLSHTQKTHFPQTCALFISSSAVLENHSVTIVQYLKGCV